MLRAEKSEVIQNLRDRFDRMSSAVFVNFKGMNVEEVSKLRDTFREKGIDYKVVKNTLVKQALSEHDWVSHLDDVLTGMTGVAWSYEDPSAAAKVVKAFAKENEKLQIKAGLIEGQVLDAKGVEDQLANMPGKDEMRAKLLGLLTQPLSDLAALLNTPATDLVRLLNTPAQNAIGVLEARKRELEG
jgi:large subunit ribosomal protein L10